MNRAPPGAEEKSPRRPDGAETLTADQILANPAQAEKWLRRVESDPGDFLQAKFRLQLQERQHGDHVNRGHSFYEEPAHAH